MAGKGRLTRDAVLSKGNVGRFQVNCTTWAGPLGYRSCPVCVRALRDRSTNIRAGIAILAYVSALNPGEEWRHVVGHYNAGCILGQAGERYARRVEFHIRRRLQWSRDEGRRW